MPLEQRADEKYATKQRSRCGCFWFWSSSTAVSVALRAALPRILFGYGFSDLENRRDARAAFLGVFEDQDAAVVQIDFRGLPRLSLVEAFGIGITIVRLILMWIPGTVEPVEMRFFVRNPFFDRLQSTVCLGFRIMRATLSFELADGLCLPMAKLGKNVEPPSKALVLR